MNTPTTNGNVLASFAGVSISKDMLQDAIFVKLRINTNIAGINDDGAMRLCLQSMIEDAMEVYNQSPDISFDCYIVDNGYMTINIYVDQKETQYSPAYVVCDVLSAIFEYVGSILLDDPETFSYMMIDIQDDCAYPDELRNDMFVCLDNSQQLFSNINWRPTVSHFLEWLQAMLIPRNFVATVFLDKNDMDASRQENYQELAITTAIVIAGEMNILCRSLRKSKVTSSAELCPVDPHVYDGEWLINTQYLCNGYGMNGNVFIVRSGSTVQSRCSVMMVQRKKLTLRLLAGLYVICRLIAEYRLQDIMRDNIDDIASCSVDVMYHDNKAIIMVTAIAVCESNSGVNTVEACQRAATSLIEANFTNAEVNKIILTERSSFKQLATDKYMQSIQVFNQFIEYSIRINGMVIPELDLTAISRFTDEISSITAEEINSLLRGFKAQTADGKQSAIIAGATGCFGSNESNGRITKLKRSLIDVFG